MQVDIELSNPSYQQATSRAWGRGNRDRKGVHIGDRRESDESRSVDVWRGRWKGGKWREEREVRPDGLAEKIILV